MSALPAPKGSASICNLVWAVLRCRSCIQLLIIGPDCVTCGLQHQRVHLGTTDVNTKVRLEWSSHLQCLTQTLLYHGPTIQLLCGLGAVSSGHSKTAPRLLSVYESLQGAALTQWACSFKAVLRLHAVFESRRVNARSFTEI